ncbi:hypothetical protein CGI18_21770 [Vibrio parahaemolyticus]|uniref:hypothetical protein n=1 Tax=Vibrio parahaemolyticus TaxID=670 RepID=UPI0011207826|nr:hypothetical protein [Vibrio parahaemolyticus]TOK42655.1 hypothetical protein CGI18_21770 [Vibrio parahaemolyticus]
MSNNDVKGNELTLRDNAVEGEWVSGSGSNGGRTYEDGFRDGVKVGVQAGFEHAVEELKRVLPLIVQQEVEKLPDIKRALSDGLRHGSPDCGRALVDRYRYKKPTTPRLN